MKIHFVFYFLFHFSIYHPFNNSLNAQNPEIIDFSQGLKRVGDLKLSEIIQNIQYIPLETKSECLISNIKEVRICDNLILLENYKPNELYAFDYSGNFISQIGKQGKGPNEYNWLISFAIDDKKQHIYLYVQNPDQFLVYNFSGELNNKYNFQEHQSISDIEFLTNNKFIAMYANYAGNTPFSYRTFTTNFDLIDESISPVRFKMKGSSSLASNFCFYTYHGSFFAKGDVLDGTIYKVLPNNQFIPCYKIDLGKYRLPLELKIKGRENSDKLLTDYVLMKSIHETKDYLLFNFHLNRKWQYAYYDKTKKTVTKLNVDGIPNDFDGGPNFKPIYQKNNKIIGFVEASELIKHVRSGNFINTNPKSHYKKQELEKLVKNLDDFDNPVIIIIELKE